jgi:hypothetical protein
MLFLLYEAFEWRSMYATNRSPCAPNSPESASPMARIIFRRAASPAARLQSAKASAIRENSVAVRAQAKSATDARPRPMNEAGTGGTCLRRVTAVVPAGQKMGVFDGSPGPIDGCLRRLALGKRWVSGNPTVGVWQPTANGGCLATWQPSGNLPATSTPMEFGHPSNYNVR